MVYSSSKKNIELLAYGTRPQSLPDYRLINHTTAVIGHTTAVIGDWSRSAKILSKQVWLVCLWFLTSSAHDCTATVTLDLRCKSPTWPDSRWSTSSLAAESRRNTQTYVRA
jgi:hypothetical protein